MIQKLIGILALFTLFAVSCKKNEADDLGGTAIIKGSLYINDTLGFLGVQPLKDQTVFFKYASDRNNLNYLYKVVTNAEGAYTLTNLRNDTTYYLYAERQVGDITFSFDSVLVRPQRDTTVLRDTLYPTFKQYSVLQITCRDTTAPPGNPLYNAEVCVFADDSTAQNNQCTGSYKRGNTDIRGNVFFAKLPARRYYINAQLVTPGRTIKQVAYLPVNVPVTGIVSREITLQ